MEMCNHDEMWRCHRWTHRDTCVSPSPHATFPVLSRRGGRLLLPSLTARSASIRSMCTESSTILYRKWDKGMEASMDPCNWPLRGTVRYRTVHCTLYSNVPLPYGTVSGRYRTDVQRHYLYDKYLYSSTTLLVTWGGYGFLNTVAAPI